MGRGDVSFDRSEAEDVVEGRLIKEITAVRGAIRRGMTFRGKKGPIAAAVLDFMDTNSGEKNLLNLTADHFHYSVRRIETLLREGTGRTYTENIKRVRLEKARSYVILTERPMDEIAEMTGYKDHATFSRAYKRHFGMTPGADRRESRGGF